MRVRAANAHGKGDWVYTGESNHIHDCRVDVSATTVDTSAAAQPAQMLQQAVSVTFSTNAIEIPEGQEQTYTVVLDSAPTGFVIIQLTSDNADVRIQPTSLTFSGEDWDQAQTVTVSAAQDDDAVDDTATISHAVSGSDEYTGIAVASVNVAVADDDTAGVTVSKSSLSINEGGSDTYTVVLDTQPVSDVGIHTFAYGGVTAQPSELIFTPDNWQTPQTVTVSAGQDDDTADEVVAIVHGIGAPPGSGYGSVVVPPVDISVTDNDEFEAQPAQQEPENNAPAAAAGPDQTVDAGDAVSLDGGSSDADGDALTYAWTQTSGPSVTLAGASSANPGFTAPNADDTLVFSLTVNDGTDDSAADTVAVTVVVPDPQRDALVAFYNATNGGNWASNGNWLSDQPLGQWRGVSTNGQGQVTHLQLRNNGLSGSLPAALGDLEALQVLSLDRNSIGGSLPSELGNLSGLTKLSLHDNTALNGALPSGFTSLANLQRLAIANTGLCAPDDEAFRDWLDTVPDKPGGVPTCE